MRLVSDWAKSGLLAQQINKSSLQHTLGNHAEDVDKRFGAQGWVAPAAVTYLA